MHLKFALLLGFTPWGQQNIWPVVYCCVKDKQLKMVVSACLSLFQNKSVKSMALLLVL